MAKHKLTGKDNTNGFQKNPQNINRKGSNRKTIAVVNLELEKSGYTPATQKDVIDCYMRLINIDLLELAKMINDDSQPAMVRIVGKAIVSGKGFDVLEKLLDRGIGKPSGSIDITTKGEKLNQISEEEFQVRLMRAKKIIDG